MNMNLINEITASQIRTDHPEFKSGDNVRVHVKITEGKKTRVQVFEGLVIARTKGGVSATFKVRKMSGSVGVERTFLLNSPIIERIEVVRRGKVRRNKLYYIRKRTGRAARIKERRN